MRHNFLEPSGVLRYLNEPENVGVEQWISWHERDGFRFIFWVRIVQERQQDSEGWCLYEKNSLDVGNETYVDMDEFEEVGDPDEPEGKRFVFESAESAFAHAEEVGARTDRFTIVGGIQYIYRDFYRENGPPKKGAKQWFSA